MRTTVTLDADTEALVRRLMRDRNLSFKEAVNDAIRAGLVGEKRGARFRTRSAPLGTPGVNLDRALQLAAQVEDDEMVRKTRVGK